MATDDLIDDALLSPTDLAAVRVSDAVLTAASGCDVHVALPGTGPFAALLAWRSALAGPIPEMVDVDTALRIVAAARSRRRSPLGRLRAWVVR